jgi:ABC-type uncharacterized transport system involved in gliding motility auxiliary subunit
MELNRKLRLRLRLHDIAYHLLLLAAAALLGWLSARYGMEADLSAQNRNTLNPASVETLAQLIGPLQVDVYISDNNEVTRNAVQQLIGRYQRHKEDLHLSFINPDTNPAKVRELGVNTLGEIIIEYQGRQERLQHLSEDTFTNTLQRLARGGERWIVFLSGHGERDPQGQQNHGLNDLGKRLADKGFRVQTHNTLSNPLIPDNTHVLVIAGPAVAYLPAETKLLLEYVENGGNLLWLADPDIKDYGLAPLAKQLGIGFLPGVVIDATAQTFGITAPDFALVVNYTPSPLTSGFSQFTLYPQAAALETFSDSNPLNFTPQPFLQTAPPSWTETGAIEGAVQFNENSKERAGPLTIGLSLSRTLDDAATPAKNEQRIVIIGDGDFLSNSFLGNGGNLELGLNIFNWLSHDDKFIDLTPVSAPDAQVELSMAALVGIASCFLLVLPLSLLAAGIAIWLRRRKR